MYRLCVYQHSNLRLGWEICIRRSAHFGVQSTHPQPFRHARTYTYTYTHTTHNIRSPCLVPTPILATTYTLLHTHTRAHTHTHNPPYFTQPVLGAGSLGVYKAFNEDELRLGVARVLEDMQTQAYLKPDASMRAHAWTPANL